MESKTKGEPVTPICSKEDAWYPGKGAGLPPSGESSELLSPLMVSIIASILGVIVVLLLMFIEVS